MVPSPTISWPVKCPADGPRSIERRRIENGNLEQGVVAANPFAYQRVELWLASSSHDKVRIVVENRPVANHDLVRRRSGNFLGDLGVKDPALSVGRRAFVDGQRATSCDLLHQIDREVEAFQLRRKVEAERRFPHSVATDERDLEARAPERAGNEIAGNSHTPDLRRFRCVVKQPGRKGVKTKGRAP